MAFASVPSCGGVGGGRTGLSVVKLRAESGSPGSTHSPQKRHLIASRRICSLQNGHSLNALSSIASMRFSGEYWRRQAEKPDGRQSGSWLFEIACVLMRFELRCLPRRKGEPWHHIMVASRDVSSGCPGLEKMPQMPQSTTWQAFLRESLRQV